jgi:CHAD domain-containing protein
VQIRQVTRALGAARDTDVQIDVVNKFYASLSEDKFKRGLNRLLLRLRQRRIKLQVKVAAALDVLITNQTLTELEQRLRPQAERQGQIYLYTPALYELSFNSIYTRLNTFLSYEGYIDKPECIAELHAMRISAKHLRYTLEAFAPLYGDEFQNTIQAMRQVQDELGEIHDSDVWNVYLPEFISKEHLRTFKYYGTTWQMSHLTPGLEYFLRDRQANRLSHYQGFLGLWQDLNASDLWGKLREMIQMPFNLGQAQEPLVPDQPEG